MYWLRAREWDEDVLNGPHASIIEAAIVARTLIYADERVDIDRIWECETVDSNGMIAPVTDFDLLV